MTCSYTVRVLVWCQSHQFSIGSGLWYGAVRQQAITGTNVDLVYVAILHN